MVTTLAVEVDETPITPHKVELNMVGLTVGHSLATVVGTGSFNVNDLVEVWVNNILVFVGRLDEANIDQSQDAVWDKQALQRLSARDLSQEFSHLKVTKIYEDTIKADDLIEDLMDEAGCAIVSFASASEAPTLAGFVANDEYLTPLIKRILEQVGWEAYVDTAGDLIMFDATNPPDSGITLADGDIIHQLYDKSGLGIRNKIKITGAPLNFDPDGSGVQGWKDNCESLVGWTALTGAIALIAGIHSTNQIKATAAANATRLTQFKLDKEFIAGFNGERKRLHLIISQALSGAPAPTFLDGSIRLLNPDNDYFYIELEPANAASYTEIDEVLGVENEYIAEENETGWKKQGTPSWNKIDRAVFRFHYTLGVAGTALIYVDLLYLEPVKWVYETESAASIALYEERQLSLERPELLTQAECDAFGDQQLILFKDQIVGWRFLVPAIKVISGGAWKALVGNKLMYALTSTRITSTRIICQPRENLKDGFDFICRVNAIPLTDRPKVWLYDLTLNPNHLRVIKK